MSDYYIFFLQNGYTNIQGDDSMRKLVVLIFSLMMILTASCASLEPEEVQVQVNEDSDTALSINGEDTDKQTEFEYVYKHRSTLSSGNDREKYIWEVLRMSLEATVEDYGAYEIVEVENINQVREDVELMDNTGLITVISDSLNDNNIENLDFVQVPLLRNLLGYRVFFINKIRQDEFETVTDSESLKPFKFGIAYGWNDKIILEHSGYEVYEEEKYEALYRSLMEGNFDIFSRGVNEIVGELDAYHEAYPDLHIEENILLYYPLPRYFWFSKSDEGAFLKARVEVGLSRIIDDGSFYELFDSYFAEDLKTLDLDQRILIELENPVYKDEYKENDQRYRFNPFE